MGKVGWTANQSVPVQFPAKQQWIFIQVFFCDSHQFGNPPKSVGSNGKDQRLGVVIKRLGDISGLISGSETSPVIANTDVAPDIERANDDYSRLTRVEPVPVDKRNDRWCR